MQLDEGVFTLTFLRRSVDFVFTSSARADGRMEGLVTCYLKNSYPEPKHIEVGHFTFAVNGETDQINPGGVGKIYLSNDSELEIIALVLNFLNDCLAK